jgi:hypothetical protein
MLSMVKSPQSSNSRSALKGCAAANETLNIRFVNNKDAWDEFVGRINRTLDKLDLEFRMLHDESTGREMYALVCSQINSAQ